MGLLPSVQPFHAIAYPIDPTLALEIRYFCEFVVYFLIGYLIQFESHCSSVLFNLGIKYYFLFLPLAKSMQHNAY